jgi:hypothetical protein
LFALAARHSTASSSSSNNTITNNNNSQGGVAYGSISKCSCFTVFTLGSGTTTTADNKYNTISNTNNSKEGEADGMLSKCLCLILFTPGSGTTTAADSFIFRVASAPRANLDDLMTSWIESTFPQQQALGTPPFFATSWLHRQKLTWLTGREQDPQR